MGNRNLESWRKNQISKQKNNEYSIGGMKASKSVLRIGWRDENFSTVTWRLLDFVAPNQLTLCYSSVLLRALTATLKSQWSSTSTAEKKTVLTTTVRLLEIMSLGQLLPPPLSSLPEVIPHLTSSEDCVWSYMRDNVPSPALFTRDPLTGFMWRDPTIGKPAPQYTETFRLILQNNIKRFGRLYSQLFININS